MFVALAIYRLSADKQWANPRKICGACPPKDSTETGARKSRLQPKKTTQTRKENETTTAVLVLVCVPACSRTIGRPY